MEHRDEENVQDYVHNTGDGQVEKGAFGVPGGPEYGGAEIVNHAEGDAAEVDLHIHGGQGQHIVRGAHHPQKCFGKAHADEREEQAAEYGGRQGGVHRIAHHGVLTAAETMGNAYARAHRQTDKEVYQQVGDGSGGAHGGHTDAAAETAYNHKIGGVEQQLE